MRRTPLWMAVRGSLPRANPAAARQWEAETRELMRRHGWWGPPLSLVLAVGHQAVRPPAVDQALMRNVIRPFWRGEPPDYIRPEIDFAGTSYLEGAI